MRLWQGWLVTLALMALLSACGNESDPAKIESVHDADPKTPVLTEAVTEPTATGSPSPSASIATRLEDMQLPSGVKLDGMLLVRQDTSLYQVNFDGTPPRTLHEGEVWDRLTVAPDHQHIAFVFLTPNAATVATPPPDVMLYFPPPTSLGILDLSTGEVRLVYESDGGLDILGWSPDGTWLAFGEAVYPPYDPAMVATSEYGDGFSYYMAQPTRSVLAVSLQPDIPVAHMDGGAMALWLTDNTLLVDVIDQTATSLEEAVYQFLPAENQVLPLQTDQVWQITNAFNNVAMRPTAQSTLKTLGLALAPLDRESWRADWAFSPDGSMYVEASGSFAPFVQGDEIPACGVYSLVQQGIERALMPQPIAQIDTKNVIGVSNMTWLPVEGDPEAVDLLYIVRTSATCEWNNNVTTTLFQRLPDGTVKALVAPPTGLIVDYVVPTGSPYIFWVWGDYTTEQSSLNLYDLGSGQNIVLAESATTMLDSVWWID